MPGVESEIAAAAGNATAGTAETAAQAFMVGVFEWGPDGTATPIRSARELLRTFGRATAYSAMYWQVLLALLGAPVVWVVRAVGAGKSKGTRALKDGSAGAGATTITLNALYYGATSDEITVEVKNGGVAFDDTTKRTVVLKYRVGQAEGITETYRDLATPAAIVAAINARSRLVVAVDAVVGGGTPLPRVLAESALSAGSDDHASLDGDDMVAFLDDLPSDEGPGIVSIPGWSVEDVGDGLKTYGATTRRIVYCAGDETDTDDDVMGFAADLVDASDAKGVGVGMGWLTITDNSGGTLNISPEGAISAVRGRTIRNDGIWQAPAGIFGLMPKSVAGLVTDIDKSTGDTLNENHVNAIRVINKTVRNYGWRSCSSDETFAGLQVADMAYAIDWDLRAAFEDEGVQHGISDNRLLEHRLEGIASSILKRKYRPGLDNLLADNGDEIDPGFVVAASASPEDKRVDVEVGFRPIGMAELVFLTISVAANGVAF